MRTSSNQNFQAISYIFALLFCFVFVTPVLAQNADPKPPGFLKTIVEYVVKITSYALNLLVQHFDGVYTFTAKYIWPFLKQIAVAIYRAFFPARA